MTGQKRTVPTDDFATITKDDVTVILSTFDEPYTLDEKFSFTTSACLIYSEKIKVTASLRKLPGKSLGLFCSEIELEKDVVIDVSGTHGKDGTTSATDNGGKGEDGNPGGQVWVFVQNATAEILQKLTIKAYGGDGGMGGDTSAAKKTGGAGGKGGDGGHTEVLFGTTIRTTALALGSLLKKPWPEQALNLAKNEVHPEVPRELTAEQKHTVDRYWQLRQAVERVAMALEAFRSNKSATKVSATISNHLRTVMSPKMPHDGFSATIASLDEAAKSLKKAAGGGSSSNIDETLTKIANTMDTLKPEDESELAEIVDEIAQTFAGRVGHLERAVRYQCRHMEPGAGGQGGNSSSAQDKPGQPGEKGKMGKTQAMNLRLNGSKFDLEANHVFAFPDQCQMLLNKAERMFFSNTTAEKEKAAVLYRTLHQRLSFVAKANLDKKESSNLAAAYAQIESQWKITMLSKVQLRSIYDQAESRLNRLTLGQDMWGHMDDWAPRLSVQFYEEDLKQDLELLEKEEHVTKEYEDALQNDRDTEAQVKEGIKAMRSNRDAADVKVKFLTSENGPIRMAVYKIEAFTPEIKAKREKIQKLLANVELQSSPLDPGEILEALTTLAGAKKNVESLLKIGKAGYDLYKSSTMAKDLKGNKVSKEYIIDQLTTCGDTLASLHEAFSTRKDNTIAVDDPGCIKILASAEDIRKIVHEFKEAIPEKTRKEIDAMLTNYIQTVQTRNDAVVEYNSSIQLLAESLANQEYFAKQIEELGDKGIKIDHTLPAIVYWLRKMRDSLRIHIMQTLNYQSRAIRYWGLQKNPPMFEPLPMQGFAFLSGQRAKLRQAFNECLQRYATSVRNTWPSDDKQQGLLRELTTEEVQTLQTNAIQTPTSTEYTVYLRIDPQSDSSTFGDRIDIRLSQVRLWLLGADLSPDASGRKLLSIQLIHLGEDVIQDDQRETFTFSHDPVNIRFEYDVAKVNTLEEARSKFVFSKQNIQEDHYIGDTAGKNSIAALGPFTMWKLVVRVNGVNQGLSLQGLKKAYLEFRGTSRSPMSAWKN